MSSSISLPLHLPQLPRKVDALDRLELHMKMAAINPKGFRDVSKKKNRKRTPTRVEKLGGLL